MNNDKTGVIVPVYKTEKFIAECIESILAQTYTNFRLILVDDGTPDNAGKICDEYAKKDNRITVIHQENAGVTRARAAGVETADDCEWITFVDSDDTLTENALDALYTATIDKDCDIVFCDVNNDNNDILIETYINIVNYRKLILANNYCGPWGKLFKKKLFSNFTFSIPRNIVIAEDLIMNLRLAFNTYKNVYFISNKIYNYRILENSTSHSHKRTPENEQDIHIQKLLSIPQEMQAEYIEATIEYRVKNFKDFWAYKYHVEDMKNSSFYKELKTDIKSYGYKLSYIERILFYCTNPIIRFFTISTRKIINIINIIRNKF